MNGRFWGLPVLLAAVSFLACALAAVPAHAQRNEVVTPRNDVKDLRGDDDVPSTYNDRRNRGAEPAYRRNVAGDFDYYALALSWSPTHCAGAAGADDDMQCNSQDGRRYSFIVHGLWPQFTRGYPENCNRTGSSYIPQQMIDRMLDIMPSKRLIIHEYRKHGTCSGHAPLAYFEFIRKAFADIQIPARYVNPFESQFVSPDDLVDDFIESNPSLKPEMLAVSCGGAGNRLKEIRLCLSKTGEPTACGANENQKRLCSASRMFVPPVRSSRVGAETLEIRERSRPQSPLPMPRVIPEPQ